MALPLVHLRFLSLSLSPLSHPLTCKPDKMILHYASAEDDLEAKGKIFLESYEVIDKVTTGNVSSCGKNWKPVIELQAESEILILEFESSVCSGEREILCFFGFGF